MSNLEKFIGDNRKEFDDKVPSAKTWSHIEAAITGKKKKKAIFLPTFKWAMATAAMLIVALVFWLKFDKKIDQKNDVVQATTTEIPGSTEVNEFAKVIVLKQEELRQISKEQPELYNKFTIDITQLDSSYKALKQQLDVTPNKEMLVEAMILNLQLQLSVLNQQLSIIKQIKQSKEYSHEKSVQKI
jgi:hypothetical protein